MKIAALALSALLALGACAPVENDADGALGSETAGTLPPQPGRSVAARDQASCQAEGGSWTRQGRLQSYMCVTSYADAGKQCTDGDQCAGDCRLPDGERAGMNSGPVTGVCQASSVPFGCFTRVEDGKAAATLCVD